MVDIDLTAQTSHAKADRGCAPRLTSDSLTLGSIGIVADVLRGVSNFRAYFNPKGVVMVKYLILSIATGLDGVKVDPDAGELVTRFVTYHWDPTRWHVVVSFTANIPLDTLSNNLCFYSTERVNLVGNTNSTIYSVYWYTKVTQAEVTTANTLYATIIFIEKP